MRLRHFPALLPMVALLAACGDDDPSGPPSGPVYESAVAVAISENGLARAIEVRGSGWDSATAVVLDGSGAVLDRAPGAGFIGDSLATVLVVGMLPEASHRVAVTLWEGTTPSAAPDTLAVDTDPLPAWIPSFGMSGTQGTPGFTTLSLPDGGVILDELGRVRWYRHSPNGALNSFQYHSNGRYTLLGRDEVDEGFLVLDRAGRTVENLVCNEFTTRFHDVRLEDDGTAWVLCDESRVMDLSPYGGPAAAAVIGTVLQHLSGDRSLLFEWKALDHFALTDLPSEVLTGGGPINFSHGNAIDFDTDGNLILSFRSLNEVTKIDPVTGEVLWRFGGLATQFGIQNDPKGVFERQHGVRVAGPAVLQMLDNGLQAPSRLVRYLVNPVTGVATMLWEFVDAPDTYTLVGGASVVLADGGGLVTFGQAGRVVEVDPAGNRRWELTDLEGTYIFRVERLAALP